MKKICQICVLAYNEGKNIVQTLDSIFSSNELLDLKVTVVANGCTDNTAEVVKKYAGNDDRVTLIDIQEGDKSNAWNDFVHYSGRQGDYYCFTDGDVTFSPDAFAILCTDLDDNPDVNLANGIPFSGRNSVALAADQERNRGVYGAIYALQSHFMDRVRQQHIRIPKGVIGDDGIVGAFAKFDLNFGRGNWQDNRVMVNRNVGFYFESIGLFEIKQYIRRLYRYSLRHHQNNIIKHLLNDCNIGHNGGEFIPPTMQELYQRYFYILKIEWRGLDTLFDIFTYYSIYNRIRRKSGKVSDRLK